MPNAHRVLLVEDDRFLRKAAEVVLQRAGLLVTTAEDGIAALRAVHEERPDLVLLDMIMPRMHGSEVLRTLKSDPATAGIPVIVLSNQGQESDREQAFRAGAVDYLVKANLSLRDLSAAVARVLTKAA
jgi:CheY-like chemotaxis protein